MDKFLNSIESPYTRIMVFALPFMLVAMGLYFYSRPYTYVVRGEAAIVCDDERAYPAQPNGIEGAAALQASIENGFEDSSIRESDMKARKLCAYGVAHDFIPFRSAPRERNYTIRLGTYAPVASDEGSGVTLSKE